MNQRCVFVTQAIKRVSEKSNNSINLSGSILEIYLNETSAPGLTQIMVVVGTFINTYKASLNLQAHPIYGGVKLIIHSQDCEVIWQLHDYIHANYVEIYDMKYCTTCTL